MAEPTMADFLQGRNTTQPYAAPMSEFTTPGDLQRERISTAFGWDVGRPGREFLRKLFLEPQGAFSWFALGSPRAASLAASAPRFRPESTVRGYHGTTRWNGVGEPRVPFWLSEDHMYPRQHAGEGGTIYPFDVDTSSYLRVREGSPMEALDLSVGLGRQLERGGRNWLADFARLTGRGGIWRESDWYNRGPSLMALDPRTVRPAADSRPIPPRGKK